MVYFFSVSLACPLRPEKYLTCFSSLLTLKQLLKLLATPKQSLLNSQKKLYQACPFPVFNKSPAHATSALRLLRHKPSLDPKAPSKSLFIFLHIITCLSQYKILVYTPTFFLKSHFSSPTFNSVDNRQTIYENFDKHLPNHL